MKLIKEDISILAPKDNDDIIDDLSKKSYEEILNLADDVYFNNHEEILLDIGRYIGQQQFKDILIDLILLRQ